MKMLSLAMKNQSIVHKWMNNKFLKHVSLMISGTAIAQLITIGSAPILSRIYTPEELGILALFMSIVSLLSVVGALRYEQAIVLPQKEEEAAKLFLLSTYIVAIVSGFTLIGCLLFDDSMSRLLGSPELEPWLIGVPIGILTTGMYQNLNYWSTRRQNFKRISVSQVIRSGGISSTQLGTGFIGLSSFGLILGQVAGQFAASIIWFVQTWRESKPLFKVRMKLNEYKQLAMKYSEFPFYSTPQTLLNGLSQNLPIFILGFFYGATTVGFYSIALRLIQLPITLVAQSVRQVFYQRVSAAEQGEINLHAMLKKTTLLLAAIAFIPSILLILFGPTLFQWVLGPAWAEAGYYASWIVTWLFFAFVNPPAIVVTTILGMQKKLLIYECALLACRFGALYIGGIYFSALTSIAIFSLVGVCFNVYLIVSMLRASKVRVNVYSRSY